MSCWPLYVGYVLSLGIFAVWVWLDHRALQRLYRHAKKLDEHGR